MVSIASGLRRIKEDVAKFLEPCFIEQVCREIGHTWRDRRLGPVATIHVFLLQMLSRNTACSHLPHLSGQTFTASAYCQARRRLPLNLITTLVFRIVGVMQQETRAARLWHGHRTILIDGSGCSMSDTPDLQVSFGQPGGQKKGCGFPVAHLLATFDAGSGLILDLIVAPLRTHDMSHVNRIHPKLRPGDLLVADRGFCSFAHLALILRHDLHACLRLHHKQIVDFRPHRRPATNRRSTGRPRSCWLERLGALDQIVAWTKPERKPAWMSPADFEALPSSIPVRELRYPVRTPGFRAREITLVTTLLDAAKYPATELAELYRSRWQVETNLRHLKTTLGMDILHCKTVDGVLKELWMFVLVYNLVRMLMLEAARRQGVEPERISFIDALRWLAHAPPDDELPPLIINPRRADRIEPRVLKRRMKEYRLMKIPRRELRQLLLEGKLVA
jgi:hypothetical protein